jgi:hypothetical protein
MAAWSMLEAPGRLSDEEARAVQRRWLVRAVALGHASPNDLRAFEFGIPVPAVIPRSSPPQRPRALVCLGCGAPSEGLARCGFCLRRF